MTSRNLCLRCVNVVSDFVYCRNLIGTVWANVELQQDVLHGATFRPENTVVYLTHFLGVI